MGLAGFSCNLAIPSARHGRKRRTAETVRYGRTRLRQSLGREASARS